MTLDTAMTARYSSRSLTQGRNKRHAEPHQIKTPALCEPRSREGEDKPPTGREKMFAKVVPEEE